MRQEGTKSFRCLKQTRSNDNMIRNMENKRYLIQIELYYNLLKDLFTKDTVYRGVIIRGTQNRF